MMNRKQTLRCVCLAGALALTACQKDENVGDVSEVLAAESKQVGSAPTESRLVRTAFNPRLLRRFKPVRSFIENEQSPVNQARIKLGRALFYDTRLSKNHDISCNSCHKLDQYGVDGRPTSVGHGGQHGGRNSPTVYHAAGYFAQFWDGRARNVEEQAKGPITNPIEMALDSPDAAVKTIKSIPQYVARFKEAFSGERDPVTFDNIAKAVGAFERGLVTPSRWDDYLRGNKDALTEQETEGLKIFTNVGCMVCHTGEFLGGSMFEKAGVVEDWPNRKDRGRYHVTEHAADEMMFKVPTLRNVEMTAPYFHDGSVETLPEAVAVMGRHQLGLELTHEEITAIVAWLKSLTGKLPMEYIAKPELPPSTAKTPKPSAS